jgi:hypothetical protein
MKRACSLTKADLQLLAELVAQAFGLPHKCLFWKAGCREVMEARRLFCLYLYAVEGMPYHKISKFLRLNRDGARMLLRNLAKREPFPYTILMQQLTTEFRAYQETIHDERKAESTMVVRPDLRPTEAQEAHGGAS